MPKHQAVILMPDHLGKGLLGLEPTAAGFTARLQEMCGFHQEWLWMPLINGFDMHLDGCDAVDEIKKKCPLPNFEPVLRNEKGVAQVMKGAYQDILERIDEFRCIVKIDNAEHPPEALESMLLPILSGEAEATLGNLWYREGMLGPNELYADGWMVGMCDRFMRQPFPISHAHGYQAFSAESFPTIYKRAMAIMQRAEKILGGPLRWGGDLCFLLAADKAKGLKEIRIPAEVERKRAKGKNLDQLKAWQAVFNASEAIS